MTWAYMESDLKKEGKCGPCHQSSFPCPPVYKIQIQWNLICFKIWNQPTFTTTTKMWNRNMSTLLDADDIATNWSALIKQMAQLIIATKKAYILIFLKTNLPFSVNVLKFLLVNSVNDPIEQVPQAIFCSYFICRRHTSKLHFSKLGGLWVCVHACMHVLLLFVCLFPG